jgi:hypothetical protein
MKKIKILFILLLFPAAWLFSQPQITWRFANPEIIRSGSTDRLEFDLQVKASAGGTYFWSGQYILTFNNFAFLSSTTNVTVIRSGISNQYSYALGDQKYSITRTITGVTPNQVINVALTPMDVAMLNELPNSEWLAELTTEWQTFTRLRITISDPSPLAGISFIEASMNSQIFYLSAPGFITNYTSPNLYESPNLNLLHLGRIYSDTHGWSQVGESQIDWVSSVNTTVFDGNATITQTNNTAALAGNLNVMDGANLTIPSNKWLTVGGILTTSDTDALTVTDGASLLHNTASVNASVERTISGGSISSTTHRYHLVSVPLNEATIVTAGDIFTGMHLWELDAVNQVWNKINFAVYPINNKNGYLIWHDENTKSLEMSGILNSTDVELPSISIGTNTDGQSYRLIPNPYPSALNWITPAGYDAAVYFFNSATGNYVTYAGGVPGPAIAPVGQSFFIKTSVPGIAGAMTISNADRLHHNQNFYKAVTEIPNLLKIKANSQTSMDEAYVRFHDQATNQFDAEMDAQKLFGFGDAPQLYTFFEEINYAINTLGLSNNHLVIPMHFKMNANGMIQLEAEGTQSFNQGFSVFLEDVYLNQMINLSVQSIYSFEHDQSNPDNRFNLHFYGVLDTDETVAATAWKAWSYNKYIYISIPEIYESTAEIELFDLTGRKIYQQKHAINNPIIIYGGDIPQLVFVKINTVSKTHTSKIIIH